MMSERDVRRIEVLTEVLSGQRTIASAAILLSVSTRQVNRLLHKFREDGAGALIHKGRGQASNHRLAPDLRTHALELIKTKYADFGPTLAVEILLDKHALKVGRETLRTWMVEDGIWLSRKQRRSFHQPRLRRECVGELVQIDGSDHRWFENRADPFCASSYASVSSLLTDIWCSG
jgi:transposase